MNRARGGARVVVGVALVLVGVTWLLDGAGAPGWVWLASGAAALWWWARAAGRRRRERAEARARARAQRLALWGLGGRRQAERPIGASSPLPRQWWEPVDLARRAVEDYRASALALPDGPVRERLLAGTTAMEGGAAELESLARRGAELDRQLRRFRSTGQWPTSDMVDGTGDGHERVARLGERVETARRRVDGRLEALRLAALEAADVAVSLSLSDADDLVSDVEHTLLRVSGLATALDDSDVRQRPTAQARRTHRTAPPPATAVARRRPQRG